jgi:DNA-binding NarL/FixJ family response regulator
MNKITVLLADDHTIVRNGIRSVLESFDEIEIVGEAGDGAEALEKVQALSPNILMIDIAMPIMNGIQAAEQVSKHHRQTRSLVLSMHDNEDYILKSVEAGAYGYLLKDTTKDEMLRALQAVARGEKYFSNTVSSIIVNAYLQRVKQTEKFQREKKAKLSKKEKGVLQLIIDGLSSREIAEKLELSIRTVDNHRANMMKRFGAKNSVELVKMAMEEKLI